MSQSGTIVDTAGIAASKNVSEQVITNYSLVRAVATDSSQLYGMQKILINFVKNQ